MKKLLLAAALASFAAPVAAQSGETVSANDPAAMLRVLEGAGYSGTLEQDGQADPLSVLDLGGWSSRIYFYGCDEATHTGCDSVQFSAGFDRKEPWTGNDAIAISGKYRFASVRLDDEGDPYVTWDVMTGKGIPSDVFLSSVLRFTQTLDDAKDMIFAED